MKTHVVVAVRFTLFSSLRGLDKGANHRGSLVINDNMSHPTTKRRITINTDAGTQHYEVVQVQRTTLADTYKLRIDSHGAAWLAAGTYDATIKGKSEASGTLALIDYEVTDDRILFVGLFSIDA